MSQRVCRSLHIHGRVQGVGYRWALCAEATRLGLTGWVRNRRDGTVEALVNGDLEAVDKLLAWAQHGPPMARVDRVTASEGNAGELSGRQGFQQIATF
ncbi:MAG: acylphosphatase [Candidatus Accumulibacter sp.]|nr:acylphosphatase [Accumulibacter sp.]